MQRSYERVIAPLESGSTNPLRSHSSYSEQRTQLLPLPLLTHLILATSLRAARSPSHLPLPTLPLLHDTDLVAYTPLLITSGQACCTTVNPVPHLHLPLYPAFPTLVMINAKTVTFASFGVNFSGKESMYILHPQKPELMRELTSSAVGSFDNPNLIQEGPICRWPTQSIFT